MTERQKRNKIRALRWDKQKEERTMEQLILSRVTPIVNKMADEAEMGNIDAGKYLLDRVFGKPKTSLDMSTGGGQPIIFMPTVLVNKFHLKGKKEEPQQVIHEINDGNKTRQNV